MNYSIEHIYALNYCLEMLIYFQSHNTASQESLFRVAHLAKCMVPLQQNIVQWTQERRMNHPNHPPSPMRSTEAIQVIPISWGHSTPLVAAILLTISINWEAATHTTRMDATPPKQAQTTTNRRRNIVFFFYVCKLANFFLALLHFEAYYCYLVKLCPKQTGVSRGSVNNGSMCR